MTRITSDIIWDFLISVYAGPGVQAACLDAQDRFGADVSLMLTLVWLDRNAVGLTEKSWQALLATSDHWQQTLLNPARARRRAAKSTGNTGSYEQLKAQELALERAALDAMIATLEPAPAAGNLFTRYCDARNIPPSLRTAIKT